MSCGELNIGKNRLSIKQKCRAQGGNARHQEDSMKCLYLIKIILLMLVITFPAILSEVNL
jgi:hypothetical protein